MKGQVEMTLDMLAQNRINVAGLVSESVNLEKFPAAFERLKKPSGQIKIMLEPI